MCLVATSQILEYGSCVWSPHLKKHIKKIEDIQRRATKLVHSIRHLTYEERLRELGIVTLEYRRDRADIIQIFKSVHGYDNLKWDHMFSTRSLFQGFPIAIFLVFYVSFEGILTWNFFP